MEIEPVYMDKNHCYILEESVAFLKRMSYGQGPFPSNAQTEVIFHRLFNLNLSVYLYVWMYY